ncbi:hypothetical protein [Saccharibacillus alkalitolerans]|uniref:Knr4/Smi1-like domain-containing protein n=1 Tax=Saccharibacillus alkalitolerans TaxID=2705290 RepID=A0ABX0F9N4_9BACL|nr:hypothetical protein [Saccharibacillus alkalitolerans]NGZ76650.1 hypothetical protein [Saccharibacillus alkalitolerans]
MLSEKVEAYCRERGWWHDDVPEEYDRALAELGIDPASAFGRFHRHVEDAPTFPSRNREIYQIGWFALNTNYALSVRSAHEALGLPEAYIPLDAFEGEGGYFYNRETGEVADVSLGEPLRRLLAGIDSPRWTDFNAFLEWFFKLDGSLENERK